MRKEEGFTLVELLAVIVILGVIVAIAVPTIGNIINKSQDTADEAEQELIVDAARIYFTIEDGVNNYSGTASVTVATLIDRGYLDVEKELKGGVIRDEQGQLSYQKSGTIFDNPKPKNN